MGLLSAGCSSNGPDAASVEAVVSAATVEANPKHVQTGDEPPCDPPARAIRPLSQAEIDQAQALAEQRSLAAIEPALETLKAFFAERRKGTPQFAEAVLSTDTTLKIFQYRGIDFVEGLGVLANRLLGGSAEWSHESERQLEAHIADQFRQHVFTEDDLKAAVEAVCASYQAKLLEIENQYLSELGIDAENNTGDERRPNHSIDDDQLITRAIGGAVDQLGKELQTTVLREYASLLIGELAGGQLAGKQDSGLVKFGKNVAAGIAVDRALEGGMAYAGYNPVQAVSAKMNADLDKLQALLIDGDETARIYHSFISHTARSNSFDRSDGNLCRNALDAIEHSGKLGMRSQLKLMRTQALGMRMLTTAVAVGARLDAVKFPAWPVLESAHFRQMTQEEFLATVRQSITYYGGDRK